MQQALARHHSIFLLILRRMRAPLILLIVLFAISVLGLTLAPGPVVDGETSYLSFFHAFYFISYTATTIGFGGSVGPEAPIVLTGAAIGSNVGRLARLNYRNTTLMLCCGAGAAIAAIFKAPITGVVFVL